VNLTPEQQAMGRRGFLKALAGTPALATLGGAATPDRPAGGGPVRLGFIGVGSQGRVLLRHLDPQFGEVRALCDINPVQLTRADEVLAQAKRPPAAHCTDWTEMLAKEDVEAVVVAVPLWQHADVVVGALDAGKHALCEKMAAWDAAGGERMRAAAARNRRVLEIGYQRFYSPLYQAAHEGVVRAGLLGDVYHARLVWHRNGNWRRTGEPPAPGYDPSPWGYPTFEHLLNWRLYRRYSQGLMAELASHQLSVTNWFFGATPEAVMATGGIHRFKDGREVNDHVYATFEYPHGRTAVFTSIESNAFDHYYEMFLGTKGTLILRAETEAFLFEEGTGKRATAVELAPRGSGAVVDATETRPAQAGGPPNAPGSTVPDRMDPGLAYRQELSGFCAAVRAGRPLACGIDRALGSGLACLRANEAIDQKQRLAI
jgi:predicted dehydrogenase